MVIVGVKNLGDSLSNSVLAESLFIVALVEHIHIKGRGLCLPQTENGNALAVVAGNIHIIRNGNNCAVIYIRDVVILLIPVFLKLAVKVNFDGLVLFGNEPCLAAGKPVIGKLCLPAVLDLLLEDTVLIADRIAHSGICVCCKTVKVAGSKTSQTAVSETCIRLVLIDHIKVNVPALENILNHFVDTEVKKACLKGTAHKEFHGNIIDFLPACGMGLVSEFSSFCTEDLNNYRGKRLVDLIIGSVDGSYVEFHLEFIAELFFKVLFGDDRHHGHLLLFSINKYAYKRQTSESILLKTSP